MTNFALYLTVAIIIFGAILARTAGISQPNPTPQSSPTKTAVVDPLENDEVVDDNLTKTLQLETFTPSNIPPPSCTPGSKIAVDLLLDNSGSMKVNQKMDKLKTAVNNFVNHLSDSDVIGVQRFLGRGKTGEVIPINFSSQNRTEFASKINALREEGGTPMKDGFLLAQQKINAAKPKPQYNGYYWVLIVLGDGGPNSNQNPVSVASQIKISGIRIISVGLELDAPNNKATPEEARAILRGVASSPSDFYEPSADQLEDIYQKIATSICR